MRSHYKIVHTTCDTGWGDLEKRIFNESVWMDKNGHQVVIVAPDGTPLFRRAKKYGFRVYAMSFTPMGRINNYRELIRIFQNEQPHVLNAHGHTDAKVALPAALVPRETARKDLALELGCDPATRFIGSVGPTSRNNGVTTIFQAFRQMRSRTDHHLLLVDHGPDNHRTRHMETAQKMGICSRTHFIEWEEDTRAGYRGIDCMVLAPEDIGGMPDNGVSRALLEAMYCSCPVIGTRTAGIPDIIQHGITGLVCDPGNASALSDLVLDTLNREAATLERVHAAREQVRRFHTIDAMGRDIIRIYRLHQVKRSRQQGFEHNFQSRE